MGGSGRACAAAVVLFALVAACAAPMRGVHHVVRRGENLFRIGKAYGVHYRELARVNGIADPSRIEVGQKIFVPRVTRSLPVEIITPRSAELRSVPHVAAGEASMIWPTRDGFVSSGFGPRNGSFHDGIDIAAPAGTPVYAARAGRVIYSDRIPGYGNIVILDHGRGLSTVYAHNLRNEVREGKVVAQGELVSLVGETGRTTGSNLHFEVRYDNVAHDPLGYLPSTAAARR